MGISDRLRRLEDRFRDRGPSLEEVEAAFQRLAESARARLHGKPMDAEQARRDEENIKRWKKASGVDLEADAERAREKLGNICAE